MALPPRTIQPDHELIPYFTLDRVGRHPAFSFATCPVNVYRTGPHDVLDRFDDVIAFAYDGNAPLVGARLLDADDMEEVATITEVVDAPEEDAIEGATYVRVAGDFAPINPVLCEPLNEFGQFIALPKTGLNSASYRISAETPEGVALLQSLLVQVGVAYVTPVLAAMGIAATAEQVEAGVLAAAQQGDDVQAAIIRTLEALVTQHEQTPVPGLTQS